MTKMMRRVVTLGAALAVCAPVVSGCGLGVISKTTSPDAAPPPDEPLTVCDPSNLPDPTCATTCAQAQQILKTDCSACHGDNTYGNLGSVTDYHSLSNVPASSQFPGWIYVLPGDPDRSLLYQRVAVTHDMPPPSPMGNPLPQPSVSDFSVLYDWIQRCIPSLPGHDAGTPIMSVDASSDAGGSFMFTSCSTTPPTGTCSIQGMICPYSTQTCKCDGGNWSCQACPAAQPATGSTCPATTVNGQTPVPFACGYGNVTCNCVADPYQSHPPAWACGVCPASVPSTAQACGNTPISCTYDREECDCVGGTWECSTPSCPSTSSLTTIPASCAGFYSCNYPQLDQSCMCSGTSNARAYMTCSCPAAAPKNGAFCQATSVPCVYSDQSCSCRPGGWQCTQMCPETTPAEGSACSSTLNCSYGNALCYCDGTTWHC